MHVDWPMITPVLLFFSCAIAAHIQAPTLYNWRSNTISELAGQNVIPNETGGNPIIMRLCYCLFGVSLLAGLLCHQYRRKAAQPFAAYPMYSCCLFSFLAGIFSTKYDYGPMDEVNNLEVRLHGVFAFLGIFCIMISLISRSIMCMDWRVKCWNVACVLLEAVLFTLFMTILNWQGLFQRLMFAVGLLWISLLYSKI